ncbi:MAG: nucleoside deaminase [Holosporales bacterium]|jgi:tRNA(adenine34) deaminase|nr:nucleoside deaminase [Holosporales bacterium]
MFDLVAMHTALDMARLANGAGCVPVGAAVVFDGRVIAMAHNNTESSSCVLPASVSHAEIIALSIACVNLSQKRLDGCELYVTLEPCPFCMAACSLMRVKKIVFGAYSLSMCIDYSSTGNYTLNNEIELIGGVMELECSRMMSNFFAAKRNNV